MAVRVNIQAVEATHLNALSKRIGVSARALGATPPVPRSADHTN